MDAIDHLREPAYRAKQIWKALYAENLTSFDEMTTLPRLLREKLAREYRMDPLNPMMERKSSDGLVEKTLFRLSDEPIFTISAICSIRTAPHQKRLACR